MRSIVLLCALAILSGCGADWTFDAWKTKAAAKHALGASVCQINRLAVRPSQVQAY
jgi:hypothetical protein